ncbi:MAG: beta-galactosidase trimerization domain-containing protein [Mariniphaga sp.]|nr:beta-galactosidase trimerization domain-containing protein [Mariniphaga sp.]
MIGDEIFTDVKSSNIRCTYRSLLNKGIMVDIIPNNSELRDYSLAIDLHPRITDEKHVRHLEEYVKSGGNLLIGSGAGLRDLNGHMRQETLPGPYSRLAGLNISEWTTLPKGKDKTSICYKNKVIPIESFAETLKPIDAQMLAYYDSTNPLLKKKPAICINQFGKGKVIYFGSYFADNSDVFVSLMIKWLKIACLSNVPSGIEILRRESKKYRWITLLNHNREAVDILLPEDMKKKIDLILLDLNQNNDSFQLPGYGVGIIVIKNEKFA